jgi:predicted DNA-binding ribbon-helix-helix protein
MGTVRNRSVYIHKHKTSVSLEDEFWDALKTIATERDERIYELVEKIEVDRQGSSLSSAIRLSVLNHFKSKAA